MISGRLGGSSPQTEWMRVTSSASWRLSGGRIPGSRRASIVFPVPGGPWSSRLCEPAAAISSARRARSCPRTSARSAALGDSSSSSESGAKDGASISPRRYATASPRCWTGIGSTPASAASGADSAAQTTRSRPAKRAPSATASVPATGRTRPSSPSSPTAACCASRSGGSWRVAARTAREIGRSKPEPSLRSAAGARFTVIRRFSGHSSAADRTPLRTRCFASWHARSAMPTIANPGTPSCRCASTSTLRGSRPTSAWVTARASTLSTLGMNMERCATRMCQSAYVFVKTPSRPALRTDVSSPTGRVGA